MLRQSLQSFLSCAKETLNRNIAARETITFVIGNGSADLDSFTSSILYAYLSSNFPLTKEISSPNVPILNIPRDDIRLRPEFSAVLRHINVTENSLITLDDLPSDDVLLEQLPPENTKWILVDHNALEGRLRKFYEKRVVGVIDHHAEENKVPMDTGNYPRVIRKCGSCTSLVTHYFMPMWSPTLSSECVHCNPEQDQVATQRDLSSEDESNAQQWNDEAAKLAISSILIDTRNLTSKDKVTNDDIQAVEFLEAKIKQGSQTSETFDRQKFFEELDAAKRNIDGLSLDDTLRKDYKEWEENGKKVGFCSVVKSMSYLADKASKQEQGHDKIADLVKLVEDFGQKRGLGICVVMASGVNDQGDFQKDLLVSVIVPECQPALEKFTTDSGGELRLEPHALLNDHIQAATDRPTWKLWRQKNVAASRKEVGPSMRHAMK